MSKVFPTRGDGCSMGPPKKTTFPAEQKKEKKQPYSSKITPTHTPNPTYPHTNTRTHPTHPPPPHTHTAQPLHTQPQTPTHPHPHTHTPTHTHTHPHTPPHTKLPFQNDGQLSFFVLRRLDFGENLNNHFSKRIFQHTRSWMH